MTDKLILLIIKANQLSQTLIQRGAQTDKPLKKESKV